MRRMYLMATILAVIAAPIATSSVVQAEVLYPWCAEYGFDYGARNCGFVSRSQCMATVSGIGGICIPNSRYFAHCRSNCGQPGSFTAVRPPIRQQW
jgi:hypothetical protein